MKLLVISIALLIFFVLSTSSVIISISAYFGFATSDKNNSTNKNQDKSKILSDEKISQTKLLPTNFEKKSQPITKTNQPSQPITKTNQPSQLPTHTTKTLQPQQPTKTPDQGITKSQPEQPISKPTEQPKEPLIPKPTEPVQEQPISKPTEPVQEQPISKPTEPPKPQCPDDYEHDGGKFCYKKCPFWWKGSSTLTQCNYDKISSTVGADTNLSIPNVCDVGQTYYQGLCYTLPDPKDNYYLSSPGIIAENCPEGSTFTGTTCQYDRGIGEIPGCPDGYDDDKAALCYKKGPDNWLGTQTLTHLQHNRVYSPSKPLSECPEGKERIGALCYDKCPNGYVRNGVDCTVNCPNSEMFRDDGLFCGKKSISAGCPAGKVLRDGLCYTINDNEEYKSPGIIGSICPVGSVWNGTSCYYDRGIGIIGNACDYGSEDYMGACYKANYDKTKCSRTAICTLQCS